ncbi:MAG: SIR2 family protein [Acidobacteriota bacterium]
MEQFVRRLVDKITSDTDASLLSALISARGYDLELIMGDLESLLSLPYVSSFVLDTGHEVNRDDAASLRSLIRHSIIREYRTIDMKSAIEVYQPLFDTIFSHVDSATDCLPIFTTNYDLAIERFCSEQYSKYDLTDGMDSPSLEGEFLWNPRMFELFGLRDNVRNIALFKLHGSVNWMRVTSTGRIVQSLPMYDVVDSDEYQNTIIYPAGSRVATSQPYLTSYQYFSRCCEHAKVILAIGYSFHDYDALASLLKARQVNDDLMLMLISPNAYDVLETTLRQLDEDAIIWARPVHGRFGDPDSQANYLTEIHNCLVRQLEK